MHICSKWKRNKLEFTPACSYFCCSIIFHIPPDAAHVPLFSTYGIPMKKIPCLMCRPVKAMGVVTWVLGHPHGLANTPWVHFTAALSRPVPLVGYDGWRGGALGFENKTTKKKKKLRRTTWNLFHNTASSMIKKDTHYTAATHHYEKPKLLFRQVLPPHLSVAHWILDLVLFCPSL